MKRFQISMDSDMNNVCRNTYIVNHIIPLCIKERDENSFTILFLVQSDTKDEDEKEYLNMYFSCDSEEDKKFIKAHALNYNNIIKNPKQLQMYMEMTNGIDSAVIYSTDLNMTVYEKKKMYYSSLAWGRDKEYRDPFVMELIIPRSIFIQLNLFFVRFVNHDISAETVFFDYKLHKVEFVTPTSIKLDGSAKPAPSSMFITNHYTAKLGPNTYRFHYISPSIFGRRLVSPMAYEPYCSLYSKDTLIDQMFFDAASDTLFIIYHEHSEIDGSFKRTLALKLSKELYNHTNFLDVYKIYEKIKEN